MDETPLTAKTAVSVLSPEEDAMAREPRAPILAEQLDARRGALRKRIRTVAREVALTANMLSPLFVVSSRLEGSWRIQHLRFEGLAPFLGVVLVGTFPVISRCSKKKMLFAPSPQFQQHSTVVFSVSKVPVFSINVFPSSARSTKENTPRRNQSPLAFRSKHHRRRETSMRTSALLASDPSAGQSRVRSSSPGVPTVIYGLVAFAIVLPTLSFFAMHARMLDRQEILSRNFAVRARACVAEIKRARVRERSLEGSSGGELLQSLTTPGTFPTITFRRRDVTFLPQAKRKKEKKTLVVPRIVK